MQSAVLLDCDRCRRGPVIPKRSMKRKPQTGLPGLFGWLKDNRRRVTRFDKRARN